MCFKIENAKERYFESKEHYLAFRNAWKKFINSDLTETNWSHTCVVHMVYNALRGKDLQEMFIPITNQNKIRNGCKPYQAYYFACQELHRAVKWGRTAYITAPFADTVTVAMLEKLLYDLKDIQL